MEEIDLSELATYEKQNYQRNQCFRNYLHSYDKHSLFWAYLIHFYRERSFSSMKQLNTLFISNLDEMKVTMACWGVRFVKGCRLGLRTQYREADGMRGPSLVVQQGSNHKVM